MSRRDDSLRLKDMLAAASEARSFAAGKTEGDPASTDGFGGTPTWRPR